MSRAHRQGSEDCRQLFARLSEYLDRELDPALCEEFDGHLEDCPPCLAFLGSLQKTVELVGDEEPRKLPDEVKQAVLDEYERLRERARRR